MPQLTEHLSLANSETAGSSSNPASDEPSRIRYVRYAGNACQYVYYDVGPDGSETFQWEEVGDVRSFPFTPSKVERDAARYLWRTGLGRHGWDAYIDLNVQPGAFDKAGLASLEDFRDFVHRSCGRGRAIEIDRMIAKCLQGMPLVNESQRR